MKNVLLINKYEDGGFRRIKIEKDGMQSIHA